MTSLLSIVVPTYQTAECLPELLRRLRLVCSALEGMDVEYIFVDDGSRDEAFALLETLARSDRQIRALRLSRNFGSNAAAMAGLTYARGDAVAVMAGDLQDPPELLPRMVQAWREGARVVLAARETRDDPLPTRILASVFNRLFRFLVFKDFPRHGFDFALLDHRAVTALVSMPEKNSYLFGQIMWLGFERRVIPYARQRRPHGESAWTLSRKVKHCIDAFTAFSYLPVRAVSLAGILLAGAGFFWAGLVVLSKLRGDVEERGFSALMVALLVLSGAQLIVSGMIGEYLWRALEEVRPRPPFVVAATINMPGSSPRRQRGLEHGPEDEAASPTGDKAVPGSADPSGSRPANEDSRLGREGKV